MIRLLWNYEVRLLPLLVSLSLFGFLHLIRKLTRIEYTPSYFALFPLSLLDSQLREHFDDMSGAYIPSKNRSFNAGLFVKSLVSFFFTFFLVPLLVGFIVAFFLEPRELWVFLALLLLWQATNCVKALNDFFSYNSFSYITGGKQTRAFFGSFYLVYLVSLFSIIRYGYKFAYPFTSQGNFRALGTAVEVALVPLIIEVGVIAVVGGLFTHWLINKDALQAEGFDEGVGENHK